MLCLGARIVYEDAVPALYVLQAAVEKLHQQLSLVGQPHSFLIRQLAAAEATAAAAQAELAAAKVRKELAGRAWRSPVVAR